MDALPKLICLLDNDGKILQANRTIERWGLASMQWARGKTLHEILHPRCELENCPFITLWESAHQQLSHANVMETRINDQVRNRFYDIVFEPGNPVAKETVDVTDSFASVTLTDITLPLIEQAKREWEVTVDALPQLICLLDKHGKILRANRTVERWGLSSVQDVKDKSLHEILHPDCEREDCKFKILWQEAYERLVEETGLEVEINDEVRNRIYNVLFQPIKPNEQDIRNNTSSFASVTLTDITEQKRLENELLKYVNQAALLQEIEVELTHSLDIQTVMAVGAKALHAVVHADNCIVMLLAGNGDVKQYHVLGFDNEQVQDILKPDSTIMDLVDEQAAILGTENLEQDMDGSGDMLLPLVSRDFLIGVVYLQGKAFDKEDYVFAQTISSRIASALDNAQLYQLSREQVLKLQTLNTEISALEQIKTDMIRLASHDLRNPVAAIKLATDTLRRTAKMQPFIDIQSRQIDSIKGSVDSMQLLIENILSNERIEAMQKQVLKQIDLCPLVEKTFEEFKLYSEHREHDYKLLMSDEPVLVQGDDALLHEVMSNFISNAIKYTDDGGKVQVHIYKKDDEARFEVKDNGIGIPEDQHEKLFQPFYRASNAQEREGSGIGLHLTKNIVERLNGKVSFSSVYGKGSTFGFSLPIISDNHKE